MYCFTRVDLTSTLRPVLSEGETILAIQDNVGLYDGNEKAANYMNGNAYLTSHRIIYVDSEQPNTNSIGVEIRLVKDSSNSLYPFYNNNNPYISPSTSTLSLQNTLSSTWICTICSYSNKPQNIKCQLCGVKRPENITSSTPPSTLSSSSISQIAATQSLEASTESDCISCRQCTFENHPDMIRCEMCDAELGNIKIDNDEILGNRVSGKSKEDFVKLAFRNGGAITFYEKMKQAMAMKEWEKPVESTKTPTDFDPVRGGISGIMRNAEKNKKEQDEYLNQAFKDIESLKTITEEMVKLAQSINTRLNKESPEASSDEISTFRTNLFKLGITKDEAGSTYHQELARELAEFLENVLDKEDGMLSLTDIYCMFNRARGVALISPNDLHKACSLFERLSLPFRLRRYESGLLVVQSIAHSDDQIAQRILECIQSKGSLSAIELASMEQKSVVLVNEQLQMVEAKGLVCRDESVEGIRYYDNLIINYVWKRN